MWCKVYGGRDCSPWLQPFWQPGVADGKVARTKEPAPAVRMEGQSAVFGPEPGQTAQAGPADMVSDKEVHSRPLATAAPRMRREGGPRQMSIDYRLDGRQIRWGTVSRCAPIPNIALVVKELMKVVRIFHTCWAFVVFASWYSLS